MDKTVVNKKSQIFLFDLILSIVILMVSMGISISYFVNISNNVDIYDLNNQILTNFVKTELNSLNGDEIRDLFIAGKIKNIHNSVAQQVSEFYYFNYNSDANNLTELFVSSYIKNQMNFKFEISNNSNFNTTSILFEQIRFPEEKSEISAVSKKTIIGFIDQDNYYIYHLRLKIWV